MGISSLDFFPIYWEVIICNLLSFLYQSFNKWEVIFHCSFNLYFLKISDIEYLFMYIWTLYVSFRKLTTQSSAHF